MRFALEHVYDAEPDAVSRAYADPALYATFESLPRAGRPQVVRHEVDADGLVRLAVHWSFAAPLSTAARAVIDPDRLSWVQESVHDLDRRTVAWVMQPDHYRDRFSSRGTYRFEPRSGGRTCRLSEGELRVRAPLVARAVERAIVEGLEEQLGAEVALVEQFIKG